MNFFMLPLAVGDWIGGIAVVVFLLVHLVNALFGDKKKAARKAGKPPRPANAAPLQPAEGRKQQSSEIEQFLKRANDRRKEKAGTPPKLPQPLGRKQSRRLVETPIEAEVIRRPPSGEGVAAHVTQHLDKSGFSARAEHMTDDLTQADVVREQKWRKKFDHRVGKLTDTSQTAASDPLAVGGAAGVSGSTGPVSTTVNPAAAGLMAMFRNPQTMRDAIILGEILQRPADRWER